MHGVCNSGYLSLSGFPNLIDIELATKSETNRGSYTHCLKIHIVTSDNTSLIETSLNKITKYEDVLINYPAKFLHTCLQKNTLPTECQQNILLACRHDNYTGITSAIQGLT